jgi:hypothetical protein
MRTLSPVTAAKHAGLDWKTLTTSERIIVSALTRAMNRHAEDWFAKWMTPEMERREAFPEEEIACASINFSDIGILSLPAPARHHHIMWTRLMIIGVPNHNCVQGFLTTEGRFVDRKEGLKIATKRGQIVKKEGNPNELYSEDMWPTPEEARLYTIVKQGEDD